ncbi:2'-5' RNA ligase [Pseudoduganella flava]|uniref:RNA 2',3'-cyclic phosphodiesterase n=1 Tax=Pseudoduganella flava TaxID=871742 RepID=A0A562PWI8_9BURK|nr:RNA 2',3'-cyclic phosphodiesterase [Pseudoduganella flava]QGZ39844.1 RNA 2',3'-cyclic phosphodiesterase [Pseudoduganella flava]TWI48769.1 2'-5' RNA ligase [Pseudoduganella flava]
MIANQPDRTPESAVTGTATRKLFFALWPGDAERAALAALQADVKGRLTPPAKLHLTLAFLGHLPAAGVPALLDIRAALAVPPVRLVFDCYGYFARPRIAWAGMTQVPAELVALHDDLVRRLGAAGFSAATHGSFKPHVTLAREAKEAPPDAPPAPVVWNVREAVLVESLPDGRYVPF